MLSLVFLLTVPAPWSTAVPQGEPPDFVHELILEVHEEYDDNELSLPIWDPVKIVGNIGGIALLIGLTQVFLTWRRRTSGRATYADWYFPALLGLTALSGFAVEILRFAGVRLAYPAYAVHLVFVFALFVNFPFSKFAHAVYYPTGFTFARSIGGRKKAAASPGRPG